MRGRGGFTLIEVMIAMGILGITALALLELQSVFTGQLKLRKADDTASRMTASLVENVRRNIKYFPVNFVENITEAQIVSLLDPATLPIRWSEDCFGIVEQGAPTSTPCYGAPGRAGVVVTPIPGGGDWSRGMLRATILFSHPQVNQGQGRLFKFVVYGS